jgi:translation elongation factor EF-1beta
VKQRAEERGESTYPIVAWSKTDKPFFTSVEEINNAMTHTLIDIGVMYDVHSLRVTGATRYLESGVGINTVMELTGHMSAETLTRIYIRLTKKEKEVKLKSAIDNIYFGKQDELTQNTSDLIKGELTEAYKLGVQALENTFEKNALFSLHRKATFGDTKKLRKLELGTSILTEKHPTSWIPMIHGICPAVKCPEGREHKCSLCPYLITGKLFIEGVVHQINLAFADFQRKTLSLQEEEKKGYRNHALAEGLETKLEEILGWKEILERIDMSMQDGEEDSGNAIVPIKDSAFGTEKIETNIAYLKNAYSAQQMGVEQDVFGLKALTIKAIQMANSSGDSQKVTELIEDETKAIDMLMGYYKNQIDVESSDTKDVTKFISNLKMLPNLK